MRRTLALGLVALVAILAGCQGQPAAVDPYDLVFKSTKATWDTVQVDIGVNVQGGEKPLTLNPGDLRLVVDTKNSKGTFHMALPIAALGVDTGTLAQLGITGNTIDMDVLFDGTALYIKSPLAPTIVPLLMLQSGGSVPSGDLTGWIRLGTKEDFQTLAGLAGGSLGGGLGGITASAAPAAADAGALKSSLDAMGITLTYAGSESHAGVDANHLKAAVDLKKLASAPGMSGANQLESMLGTGTATASGDLWLDKGNNRLVGVDLHGSGTEGSVAGTFDLTVTFKAPDAGASFDTPTSFVDLQLMSLLGQLMGSFGGGLPTP